jgi:hypothetical protein
LHGKIFLTLIFTGLFPEKFFDLFLMSGKFLKPPRLPPPPPPLANIFGKNIGKKSKFAAGHHGFWQGNSGRHPTN